MGELEYNKKKAKDFLHITLNEGLSDVISDLKRHRPTNPSSEWDSIRRQYDRIIKTLMRLKRK